MTHSGYRQPWQSADTSDTELQADVMRFVAILALSIVAISSLVEEVTSPRVAAVDSTVMVSDHEPVSPVAPPLVNPPQATLPTKPETDDRPVSGRAPEPPKAVPSTSPPMAPAPPVPPPKSVSARTGGAVPITPSPPAETDSVETRREPQKDDPKPAQGFTLQFETDAALLRLLALGDVAVYVFAVTETLRLVYGSSGPVFVPSAQPRQFHAISPRTVPAVLRAALTEARGSVDEPVWGVTLPVDTRNALAEILRTRDGGDLIIRSDGQVFLEQDDG